jgi:hypothetical protein
MLEERGVATVAIAAVRAQAENTRPPRALWTTAQLGRPLGEPGDAAFQRRVLLAALGLLATTDGPVILRDFAEDPPGWADNPAWSPPPTRAGPVDALGAEIEVLRPAWERARTRFGRTTIGLAFQPPEAWSGFIARCLGGEEATVAGHATPALAWRFLCDDVKAYYGEVGQADGSAPSSRQLDHWFWSATTAGAALRALRAVGTASANNGLRAVAGRFFVPAPFLGG